MELGLEGRVALVMGASRGIGRAIAGALVREGARVAIASRSEERIAAAAEEIGGGPLVAGAGGSARVGQLPVGVGEAVGAVHIPGAHTGRAPARRPPPP